ncbi:GNAT family N-acetyltransferase [Acidisoma silvae]|uniref:N-acetyltransferase n=1 Tax=Acidisoma silvae TaxID=2802396 RepID=A0A964DXE7_9PROT|nr:GNAT family N-acetyltransferase [Acidisoma silvae]MCB8874215.1 N-acetyltransferase [Acidisoma silvae]
MTDSPSFSLSLHSSIHDIDARDWNACAGADNPFVSHEFLSAVEDSGSAGSRTGWLPQHAVLRDEANVIQGIVPLYAKSHSYGEYVFDHGWASAFERAGGSYYPKLQAAVPFSPVPGPRLLRRPGSTVPAAALAQTLVQACEELDLSSVHVTFCEQEDWQALGQAGWLQRIGTQFHWTNAGYGSFDDFLGAMSSRKRKSIRRERRDAQAAGLTFRTLRGAEITRPLWDAFFGFYQSTVDRKWGSAYLTRRFFPMLSERLGDRVVLMMAFNGDKPVAAALNLVGADALYGRNWGCDGDWPFLHFELCYYRAIDFAIEHGIARVEAGAQGEHKIQRGYLPVPTFSAHWLTHSGLRQAVASFLEEERPSILQHMEELSELSPFKDEG